MDVGNIHEPSWLAVASGIIALASLILNVFIVPGGIYLMRAFVREEIKVHDGTEHAHPNLKAAGSLEQKLDDLSRTVARSFENLGSQLSSLRLELAEGMANQSKERRDEIDKAIHEHEDRETENNKRIIDEARAMTERGGRKK